MSEWKIDVNEDQKIISLFMKYENVTNDDIVRLEVADYVYKGKVGFERKKADGDFLNLSDVQAKAKELILTYPEHHFLIVEGSPQQAYRTIRNLYTEKMFYSLVGNMASLTAMGVPPIFCGDKYALFHFMVKTAKKCLDDKIRIPTMRISKTFPERKVDNRAIRVIMSFGVGEQIARQLLSECGTVFGVIHCLVVNPDLLLYVGGVGPDTVKKMEEVFCLQYNLEESNLISEIDEEEEGWFE